MKIASTVAALLISLAITSLAGTAGAAVEYPPELDAADDCTLWRGTVSGNDATVRMMFRLCPGAGDAVAGTGQWSSKVSGYNVRRLSGRWLDKGARLELHDEAVIEQHPEPGWRFCPIDRYALVRHGDELTGTYDSSACKDHATVSVTLVVTAPPAGASGVPAPSAPPPAVSAPGSPSANAPSSSSPSDPKPPRASKSCGCSCPGRPAVPSGAFVALVALVALVTCWRRPPRAHRPSAHPRCHK